MRPRSDLAGRRFGNLTVVNRAAAGRRPKWICVCDCGTRIPVRGDSLHSGRTSSCGCGRRGRSMRYPSLPWQERFRLKIWQRGDCYEWRGQRRSDGYGRFEIIGGTPLAAHRIAYEIAKGPIHNGYDLDHLCRHPWCVRPTHLEAVPHRINILRGIAPSAQNAAKPSCPKCGGQYRTVYHGHHQSRRCSICDRIKDQHRAKRKRAVM